MSNENVIEFKRESSVDRVIDAINADRDDIEEIVVSFRSKKSGIVQVAWSEMQLANLTYHMAAVDLEITGAMSE